MASAAKWLLNPAASFWRADGKRAERNFVSENNKAGCCFNRGVSKIFEAGYSPILPF